MKVKDIEKRKGRVKITYDLIKSMTIEDAKILFQDLIILKADENLMENIIEYWAISEHFDIVKEGEHISYYVAECTRHKNKPITIKWKKIHESWIENEKIINKKKKKNYLKKILSEIDRLIKRGNYAKAKK